MYYLILLTLITLALFFSYLHTKMKKEYVYGAWKDGVKKALALLPEKNIPEAILINNKRIVAIKMYYAFFDKCYWKDANILNAQNAAMAYVNESAEFDIDPAVSLSESEIITLCNKFALKNKRSLCLIKRGYLNGKEPQIDDYINHLENNESLL